MLEIMIFQVKFYCELHSFIKDMKDKMLGSCILKNPCQIQQHTIVCMEFDLIDLFRLGKILF